MKMCTKGEKIFNYCNVIFLILLALITLYPIVYVFSASLSSNDAVVQGNVTLLPKNFTLSAYKYILEDKNIWIGYANSVFNTVVGTAISLVLTICGAYPLSKKDLPGGKIISFLIVVTMWLQAGTIPTYLNLRDLGMINSRWSVIIAFAVTTYNFVLMRNFFSSIPQSLEEAAEIDGANQFQILAKIYLPLSMASIATVGLFYAVARWNSYFWEMILLTEDNVMPLQVYIKKLIVDLQSKDTELMAANSAYGKETVVYASIMVAVIPMLILYPFIQRYFVKGVMVGAVKG